MKLIRNIAFSLIIISFILALSSFTEAAELVKKHDTIQIKTHQVRTGESLWSISNDYNIPVEKIMKFNQLKDKKINQGQQLKIPYFKTIYLIKVKKEETLWSISQQFNTTVEKLKLYNNLGANTIYSNQYLILIKDNPNIFYSEKEIKDKQTLHVKEENNYWILHALSKLKAADSTDKPIRKEISNHDTLTQLKLTIMLDQILTELKEINTESLKAKIKELAEENKELKKLVNSNQETSRLNRRELKEFQTTIKLFKEELSNLGIKIDDLEQEVKYLLEKEKEEEKYTKTKLTGSNTVEWETYKLNDSENINLNQILFFNFHNIVTPEKKIDFFFQAVHDYRTEKEERLTFGTKSKFAVNDSTDLKLTYAYQKPFIPGIPDKNPNLSTRRTYFDIRWALNTPKFDFKAISAYTDYSLAISNTQKMLNAVETTLKTELLDLNLQYKQHQTGFIPLFITGKPLIDKTYLTENNKEFSGKFIFPLMEMLDLSLGVKGQKSSLGGLAGVNLHSSDESWQWDLNYIHWESSSVEDYRISSSLGVNTKTLQASSQIDYLTVDNNNDSTLKMKNEITAQITDYLALDLEYNENIENPAFSKSKAGITISF